MIVTRIADPVELAAHAKHFNALAGGVPFRQWQWLSAWWDAYGADRELFVVVVKNDRGDWIGAAPFCRETSLASGRTLRFLGSGKACTDYLTVMAGESDATEVVDSIARWLFRAAGDPRDGWELLELENVPACDTRWERMADTFAQLGAEVHHRPALHCWSIPDFEDWESYLRRLSKSHRKQVRRILKRDLADPRFAVRRATEPAEFTNGWGHLVDLHQRRWRARNEDGCFSNPDFTQFLQSAAEQFFAAEQLELWWLEEQGKPVAAQIDFLGSEGTFSYQAGMDPSISEYGPGQLLQIAVMKHAADNACRRYDFLRGDEGYKAHWRAEPTVCFTTRITPPKVGAQLRSRAWTAKQSVKAWIKSSFGMHPDSPETSA